MNNLYNKLKRKRSISGIKKCFEQNGFTVLPPSGGDYTIWTNGERSVDVKVERNIGDSYAEDYDVYICVGWNVEIVINENSFE